MTEQGELVRGLLVRFALERLPGAPDASADTAQSAEGAYAELQLSDAARFYPSDAALARWRSQADAGRAVIAYD
jgi:DNA polymerase-3 subunit alpha